MTLPFFFLLAASPVAASAAAPPAPIAHTPRVTAELVSEGQSLKAGETNELGLRLQMAPEWHTYWRFPGDSGLPTEVKWHLPSGWTAGPLEWPRPQRIFLPPLVNFGYHGEALLAAKIKVPKGEHGEFSVGASVSWLVCKEECVPEKVELATKLRVGPEGSAAGPFAAAFASLRGEQPTGDPLSAKVLLRGNRLGLKLPAPAVSEGVDFFPLAPMVVKGDKAPERERDGDSVILWLEKGDPFDAKATVVNGILYGAGSVRELTAPLSAAETGTPAPLPESSAPWALVIFAFLGGLILNLMPCVFPVLGIKVMSLVRHSGEGKARVRAHGRAYAVGVVLCFFALAGALLGLRSAGKAVGWGFQLQDPTFVTALIFLFTFVAADLAGFVRWSGRWMGAGSGLANREGLAGSFFTGVLAVIVATPCTAPFMGTAIGAAIAEPAWVVLVVFAAIGAGLASPFLLLCYHPSYLSFLPKPGAWMERLKELFAFPIAATVLWLLWVLALQVGAEGALMVEAALLVILLSVWTRRRLNGFFAQLASLALLFLGLASCWWAVQTGAARSTAENAWLPYNESAVMEARTAGRPVFVDFTAAWCLTCQVNKKLILDRASMQDYFRQKKVALFLADWTNRDPAITRALEAQGRLGVPLYLAYPPGGAPGEVLPQILTEDRIKAAFP